MTTETRTPSATQLLLVHLVFERRLTHKGNYPNENALSYGHILRHEHTYIMGMRDKEPNRRGDLGVVTPG